jgi:DNA polymerase-3 subunit epsilon
VYVVIDVETTGLRTSWHDRVIEFAAVLMDDRGRVLDEWCSLINPDRDLGPQHIHGISAAEVRRAPTFAQLAGRIGGLLQGRVVVAHNLSFDAMFIAAEFRKLGIDIPIIVDHGLCTMRLASHFLPTAGRSLHDCRRAAGLGVHRAHSALHDAHAAAELLAHYLALAGTPAPWVGTVTAAANCPWPALPPSESTPVLRRRPDDREPHFLSRLVDRLPRQRDPRADAYLDLLDQAVLDRHISAAEADGLVAAAEALDLARADVEHLHRQYLTSIAAIALDDGVLTAAERHDLDGLAFLVGLESSAVDDALRAATQVSNHRESWQLRPGDLVVFTGSMVPERDVWQAEAAAAGLAVGDGVTKKTRLLIAADPDSLSGKAKKARQYGIPIVHPAAYQQMLDGLRVASG